jgi:hypothetical protein
LVAIRGEKRRKEGGKVVRATLMKNELGPKTRLLWLTLGSRKTVGQRQWILAGSKSTVERQTHNFGKKEPFEQVTSLCG